MNKEIADALVTSFYTQLEITTSRKKEISFISFNSFYIQKGKALSKNFMLCLGKI